MLNKKRLFTALSSCVIFGTLLIFSVFAQSNPTLTQISPNPLPPIKEGETTQFTITIQNKGTQGTVTIIVTSEAYTTSPATDSFEMQQNETKTCTYSAQALDHNDKKIYITIQGEVEPESWVFDSNTDTSTLEGEISDAEGYTPFEIPDYTVSEEPPETPGSYEPEHSTNSEKTSQSDNSQLYIIIILSVIVALLVGILIGLRKKQKRDD